MSDGSDVSQDPDGTFTDMLIRRTEADMTDLAKAEVAADSRRRAAVGQLEEISHEKAILGAAKNFLADHQGMSCTEISEALAAELAEAEALVEVARERVEGLRGQVRDLQGYRRVVAQQNAGAAREPATEAAR